MKRPIRYYIKYKLPRRVKYYFTKFLYVIVICVIGFGVGTFYPNFITKNSLEEKAIDKTIRWARDIGFMEPIIKTSTDGEFIDTMIKCIEYLNLEINKKDRIPAELIIAQAIIESNAGTSRFAREGNNLFGIRTWNKDMGMLPHGYNENLSWRVKSYKTKCASVKDYITILNTKHHYESFRKARNKFWGEADSIELAKHLESWSTTKDYEDRVINIIKTLRKDGKVKIKR